MKGATQALFSWSLRSDAGHLAPHLVRGGFAVFVLLSVSTAVADAASATGPGLRFFTVICYLNLVLITVAGMSYFVSAVTEEKDAGTLALLQLAGASPLAIILSKSTSRLISAVMLLLIQLPFTLLAVTLGGITGTQVMAAYLALVAWLCVVANAALLCSVISPSTARAALRASLLLALLLLLGPLASKVAALTRPAWLAPEVEQWIQDSATTLNSQLDRVSVLTRLGQVLQPSGTQTLVNRQFWASLLGGGCLFVVSCLSFNRFTRPAARPLSARSASIRRVAVSRVWRLSVVWKDYLFYTGGVTGTLLRGLGYAGTIVSFLMYQSLTGGSTQWLLRHDMAWYCFLTLVGGVSLELVYLTGGLMVHEAERRTLAPLVLTPQSGIRILLQKLAACGIALIPGMLAVGVVLLMDGPSVFYHMNADMVIWGAFQILLCSHLTTLVSMYSRWAALPLSLFLTAASNMCFIPVILALSQAIPAFAALNGVVMGPVILTTVNLIWAWVFVLLPLEIEILRAWNRQAERS